MLSIESSVRNRLRTPLSPSQGLRPCFASAAHAASEGANQKPLVSRLRRGSASGW